MKGQEENNSKREWKKAKGSVKGIESRIDRAKRRQTVVKRGGERILKREKGFVEEKKEKRFRKKGREEEQTSKERLERKKGRREGASWKQNSMNLERSKEREKENKKESDSGRSREI